MAKVTVKLPVGAVTASGLSEVTVEATTAGEAIDKAIAVQARRRPRGRAR